MWVGSNNARPDRFPPVYRRRFQESVPYLVWASRWASARSGSVKASAAQLQRNLSVSRTNQACQSSSGETNRSRSSLRPGSSGAAGDRAKRMLPC